MGSTTGKVLGASTSIGGGIAVLPNTSGSFVLSSVAIVAIVSGAAVLFSVLSTTLYKKFAK